MIQEKYYEQDLELGPLIVERRFFLNKKISILTDSGDFNLCIGQKVNS